MFNNLIRRIRSGIAAFGNPEGSKTRIITNILESGYAGSYNTYESQITQLRHKYNGTAQWGCAVAKSVILLRSAFISGASVKVRAKSPGAKSTQEFFEKFLQYNRFNYDFMNNLVRESEIEGKSLLVLNPENETIRVRYVSYAAHRYTIHVAQNDYTSIVNVTFGGGLNRSFGGETTLYPNQFVFVKLGGDPDEYTETYPRLGALLRNFDNLDMALCGWRKMNDLFASPTPWINFGDALTAREFDEAQRTARNENGAMAWSVGKLLITANADFKMVTADNSGQESLQNEIMMQSKIISAGSGVPVHFLGLPELMSNRSTADNLRELIEASTEYERSCWIAGMNELKDKVITMANETYNLGLDKDSIEIELPYVGQQELENLVKVLLPIRNSGAMSTESFVSRIPFIDDPKKEMARIKKEATELPMPEQNLPGVDTRNQDNSRVSQRAKPSGGSNQGVG